MLSLNNCCDTTPLIGGGGGTFRHSNMNWIHKWLYHSKQFFESINPLNGFKDGEDLENYMYKKSLEIEPKDADKCDVVKSIRPANVLKSPGIKPPKNLASLPSTSGMSNHYGRYRRSARFSTSTNNYSPSILSDALDVSRSTLSNLSVEDKNTHFGVVDINPGHSPRYLGDVWRGPQPLTSPPALKPPPLVPRLRKQKASSTPPSPHAMRFGNSQNGESGQMPPPLFPRRRSPLCSAHSPKDVPNNSNNNNNNSIHSAFFSSARKESTRFVFPPTELLENKREIVTDTPSTSTVPSVPAVPPRKRGDVLPPPLPLDTVRTIWTCDATAEVAEKLGNVAASRVIGGDEVSPPPLFPRRSAEQYISPPPRPAKKSVTRRAPATVTGAQNLLERTTSETTIVPPSPPPLPPKTYRLRQRH